MDLHPNRAPIPPSRALRLRDTWFLDRRAVVELLLCYVGLVAVGAAIGKLLVAADGSALVRTDLRVSRWFVEQRTPTLDQWSLFGSGLAETVTKVVVTAVVMVALLLLLRHWRNALVVAVPLVLEAAAFITVTWIVGRPRPPVPRLDDSPVDSSFPSGHVAAAVCYAAFVVVLWWYVRTRWIRAVAVAIAVAIAVAVALARMYRGMHFLTDTLAGAALGAASVALSLVVLRRAAARHGQRWPATAGDDTEPAEVTARPAPLPSR